MLPRALYLTDRFARLRLLLLIAAVGLFAASAIACDGDSEAADEPTTAPEVSDLPDEELVGEDIPDAPDDFESVPPVLTVTAGDASMDAALGTYCWVTICADAYAPITPADVLAVDVGELTATLASETITEASVTASPVDPAAGEPVDDGRLQGWPSALGEGTALTATVDGASIDVDFSSLESGTYVLSFFVRFESGGDASYGVLLGVDVAS